MQRLIYILTLIVCCACGQIKHIPTVEHQIDTVYKSNNVYQHDSIYVYNNTTTQIKGDTVYIRETLYKDRWKIKEVHDTTYKDKVIEKTVTEKEYIEKELTVLQKLFMLLGRVLSFALVLFLIYKLIKTKLL